MTSESTTETHTLGAAVAALSTRIDRASDWISELACEARRAEKERADLRLAADRLLAVMPAEMRPKARRLLVEAGAPVAPPERPAYGAATMAAVRLLADCPRGQITTEELQAGLYQRGLAPDSRAAARLLGRLARQGVVTREERGRYRIERDHPRLSA